MQNVVKQDGCAPDSAPPQTDNEWCEGTFKVECCCSELVSRTFIVPIPPQSEAQLVNFLQGTVNNYESQGYVVLAHSLIDTGAGWTLGLSIGWHQ